MIKGKIAEIVKEKGRDIWCVAGTDGIDKILAEETDEILNLILNSLPDMSEEEYPYPYGKDGIRGNAFEAGLKAYKNKIKEMLKGEKDG